MPGWSCWQPFIDRIEREYGFRPAQPCYVYDFIYPRVHAERGYACVRNAYSRLEPVHPAAVPNA